MSFDPDMLDAVFGAGSAGPEPAERARTSTRMFVRSQMQLGFDNPIAKGRRLGAEEALERFGYPALEKVAVDGRAHLFQSVNEPSGTLRARRDELRFSCKTVADRAGVSVKDVENAEKPGRLNSIHVLERIAEALALDERVLTSVPGARGDSELGLQLRTLGDADAKDEKTASILADAAWIIERQVRLRDRLEGPPPYLASFEGGSDDYAYRTFEKGYVLAARTRLMLDLDEMEPIRSVRSVTEDLLGIPIVEAPLGGRIAGATVVNNKVRGIVLSSMLASANKVLLRRTTIAHELGHALWDPDAFLGRIKVDTESSVSAPGAKKETDKVEKRARAFAIAFLAPPRAIRRIYRDTKSVSATVNETIRRFGLSAPAAVYHVGNVCRLKLGDLPPPRTPHEAHAQWDSHERPRLTELRLSDVPLLRRGRFAELVVGAWRNGRISEDTASSWLRQPVRSVTGSPDQVASAANVFGLQD